MKTPIGINDKKTGQIIEHEEYYLMKENNIYKFIIGKEERRIIIQCKNYEIELNNNDLSILTKSIFNTLDDSYELLINIFEENKVKIKQILKNKSINLLLKILINNKEKDVEIILSYNKENKDLIINELNNKYYNFQKEINNLKEQINFLKEEIKILKISKKKSNPFSQYIPSSYEKKFKSNPKQINYLKDLVIDSYSYWELDNTFIIFKSIDGKIFLIYANEKKSIISYDIVNNKLIKEIKNAHDNYIINFRYYYDKINNQDLFMSISNDNIKLWNINKWDNLLNLKDINKNGWIFSACFLNDNNKNYIATSNSNLGTCEPIKVFDFKGNKIKEINDSNDNNYFIDSYYDNKLLNYYIITGSKGYIKSYDYNNNKIYYKYNDNKEFNNKFPHQSITIIDKEEIIKLIDSSEDGNIRIWNFHSGLLLNKIKIDNCELYGICLWNNEYLFVGCSDKNIKIINLKKGIIIKDLISHNNKVINIKKIIHPKYGECLVSQNCGYSHINLWIINK